MRRLLWTLYIFSDPIPTKKGLQLSTTTRNVFLVGLLALALLAAALGTIAPKASATIDEKSECSPGYVCFWSGKTFGRAECQSGLNCFSEFHGYEVGWHNLENINPQSMYNHTGEHVAWFLIGCCDAFPVGPGGTEQWSSPYGDGFEMK